MRVEFSRPITFNLTGYDREPAEFAAGEHEIAAPYADRVASWLRANPRYGRVIDDGKAVSVASGEATPLLASSEAETEGDGLDRLTVAELRARAAALGVSETARMTKGAAILAIREAQDAAEEPDEEEDEE